MPTRLAKLVFLVIAIGSLSARADEVQRLPTPANYPEVYPATSPYPTTAPVELLEPAPAVETVSTSNDTPATELNLDTQVAPPTRWYYPSYWFGPTPWDTGFELGLNGSSGNNDVLSTRVGGYVKRKSKGRKLDVSLYHNRTKTAGIETQHNALLDFRHDWLMADSPWSVFLLNQTFYDEFQSFDVNVNLNGGIAYQFVDEECWKFGVSLGTGASREFGAQRDEWVPEGQAGIKWEQQVASNQKFYAELDYFPEWEDFNRYRMMTDVGWEVELSRPSNVSLKLSLADRFDSHPEGFNPHNTNYSVLLLWKM